MVNTIRRPRSEIYDFRSTFSLTLESLLCVAATYTLGGTAFKHSPFRAASPARQPRALARLGARAARLATETLCLVPGVLTACLSITISKRKTVVTIFFDSDRPVSLKMET